MKIYKTYSVEYNWIMSLETREDIKRVGFRMVRLGLEVLHKIVIMPYDFMDARIEASRLRQRQKIVDDFEARERMESGDAPPDWYLDIKH